MGIPSEMRDFWSNSRKMASFSIASPAEDQRTEEIQNCTKEGVIAGAKAGAIACVASAVPTLLACRSIPWAKRNINHAGKTYIITSATVAAYFITADKAMLACGRRNTHYDKTT